MNNDTAVSHAIGDAKDLIQKLNGNGSPPITRDGKTIDGESLAKWLRALRKKIDEFLAE